MNYDELQPDPLKLQHQSLDLFIVQSIVVDNFHIKYPVVLFEKEVLFVFQTIHQCPRV